MMKVYLLIESWEQGSSVAVAAYATKEGAEREQQLTEDLVRASKTQGVRYSVRELEVNE